MEPTTQPPAPPTGLPDPEDGRLMGSGGVAQKEAERIARDVHETYRRAKERRRYRDLTAEKYLIHIDGEGDGQWVDILDGGRIDVPPAMPGGLRLQHNLLRPLVDNAVAYHTAQRYAVVAEAGPGREARDRARIDTIFGNSVIQRTQLNNVVAEGLFFAAAYGHSPIHSSWRDDLTSEAYEPIFSWSEITRNFPELLELYGEEEPELVRGFPDFWCGDPWATVYNEGARRSSVQWSIYSRVLPLKILKETFGHVPWAQDLQGSDRLPSASRFQRIVRKWARTGRQKHGTAAVEEGGKGEELVGVYFREMVPGVDRDFPEGRLTIVALDGAAEEGSEGGVASTGGKPVLLHDGALPGRRFSATRVYMNFRADDVLGKPYVADLDDLQVQLNQLVTLEHEFVRRYARPPLVVGPGGLVDDTVVTDDDAILETASDSRITPQFLFPPQGGVNIYSNAIERVADQMFRLGGWQAASRGESRAGDPAAKVIALMRADDTIFGPANEKIREAVGEMLQTAHALALENMIVPMDLQGLSGDDLAHLHEPYIDRNSMSPDPPRYTVVSGYGATPEATGQQLLQLVQMRGADGMPILPTEEFWRKYPDHTIRPPEVTANHLRTQKAARVNQLIQNIADALMQQVGEEQAPHFAPYAIHQIGQLYPIERTDNPQVHIEALDLIVQDPDESVASRQIARIRQAQFFEILAGVPPSSPDEQEAPRGGGGRPPSGGGGGDSPEEVIESPQKGRVADETVSQLTQQAMAIQ
jgi:hypothetical protein